MDFRQRLAQHRELVARLHEMEQRFETERRASLAALPARFGYTDLDSFLGAVRAAALGQTIGREAPRPRGRRPSPAPPASHALAPTATRPAPVRLIKPVTAPSSVSSAAATSAPTAPRPPASPPGMAAAAATANVIEPSAPAPASAPAPQIAPPVAPAMPAAAAPAPSTPTPPPVIPATPSAAPSLSAGAAPTPTPAPAPTRPTGTSLDDPANFGLMPDRGLLSRDGLELHAFRDRLAEALRFAQRVLHTSRVPAAVWREWRQFERQAAEALRAATPGPTPDFD